MKLDGFLQGWRTTVVQVRRRVGYSPEWRGPPFVGSWFLSWFDVGYDWRWIVVRTAAHQIGPHAMQQEVAVDPFHDAEIRRVAIRAAHGLEEFLPSPGLFGRGSR